MEQFKNGSAVTTLDGSIISSDTSITVADATVFPSSPNFRIRIEGEILLVTAIAGDVLTVTRAQEGTSAQSHADTEPVDYVITAGSLDQFVADNVQTGPIASLPSSGMEAGVIYVPTDAPYICRHTGSAWEYWGPIQKWTQINQSDFTWVNQGSASLDQTYGPLRVTMPVDATFQVRGMVKTAPSTPYRVTAKWSMMEDYTQYWGACIILRESSSGKMKTWGNIYRTTGGLRGDFIKWDSPTAFNASYYPFVGNLFLIGEFVSRDIWWSVRNNGTNLFVDWSYDGYNFFTFDGTRTTTDFCTPDQIGFGVISGHATLAPITVFYSLDVS